MRTTSWRTEAQGLSTAPVPEQLFRTSFAALTMDASRKTSCHPMKWVVERKTAFWFSTRGPERHPYYLRALRARRSAAAPKERRRGGRSLIPIDESEAQTSTLRRALMENQRAPAQIARTEPPAVGGIRPRYLSASTPGSEQVLPVHLSRNSFSKLQTLSTCASLS